MVVGDQKASKHTAAAEKFIEWASNKDYEKTVGQRLGWAKVPAGKRISTNDIPEYQKSAAAFYKQTQDAISSADPRTLASSRGRHPESSSSPFPSSQTWPPRCLRA